MYAVILELIHKDDAWLDRVALLDDDNRVRIFKTLDEAERTAESLLGPETNCVLAMILPVVNGITSGIYECQPSGMNKGACDTPVQVSTDDA